MSANPDAAGAKSSIQVVERMMNLLDALASHNDAVNLKQLAADTALHRPRRIAFWA